MTATTASYVVMMPLLIGMSNLFVPGVMSSSGSKHAACYNTKEEHKARNSSDNVLREIKVVSALPF